ncbi:putative uncharacterized protein PQLC2L isoform X2 [Numida meleagris]|uniref:putative uncharacterized protein PQLC2L isoform X2 n=1 Tax=Numida meleagris TaxID=8996 RepID=UPI000B3DC5BF|nr:putative uncharacterized protein PQLC2L isoform X2 [Numida meleagris]
MRLEITVISSIRLHAEVFHSGYSALSNLRCLSEWKGGPSAVFGLSAVLDSWRSHKSYRLLFSKSTANSERCMSLPYGSFPKLEVDTRVDGDVFCFTTSCAALFHLPHCKGGRETLSSDFLRQEALRWGDSRLLGNWVEQTPASGQEKIDQSAQTVTAISYVNMDVILISQFVYYKLKNQKMMKCSKSLKNFCVTWILMCVTLCIVLPCQLLIRNQDQSSVMERSNNSLDMIEMSGFVCGYISCVFYLGSRFPQLYKNFQRKSTEGTSYLLFALAMLGNCTYGLSLVLKMPTTESFRALYFLHHLPWLLGSFGVLLLDVFVTVQFLLYGQHKGRQHALVALEVEPLLLGEEQPSTVLSPAHAW